jgi:hypothetical protein
MVNVMTSTLENEILIFTRWRDAALEQGLGNAAGRLQEEITTRQMAILRLEQQARKN